MALALKVVSSDPAFSGSFWLTPSKGGWSGKEVSWGKLAQQEQAGLLPDFLTREWETKPSGDGGPGSQDRVTGEEETFGLCVHAAGPDTVQGPWGAHCSCFLELCGFSGEGSGTPCLLCTHGGPLASLG